MIISKHPLIVAGLILLATVASLVAQSAITTPIDLQLVPELLDASDPGLGGLPHYKYGIYASLGGSTTPQLYEFDTGGTGFYAVDSANARSDSQAWGTNYTIVDPTGGNTSYTSGNVYRGASVSSAVSLYSASGGSSALTPSITTAPVIVGQTLSITNANDTPSVLWPSATAPIPKNFFGDFGLGLGAASNGIMNVLAQLTYTNGVIPGFIVSLGAQPQATNGIPTATLQVGLTADELAAYPIKVYLNGSNASSVFAGSGLPTYSEAALSSSVTLSNAPNGESSFTMPIVIDSGATPTFHYSTNATTLTPYFKNGATGGGVSDGTTCSLTVTTTNGTLTNIYTAGIGGNAPNIGILTTTTNVNGGGLYDLNIGEQLYYNYNVAYDLQDGIIAFQPISPVPEENSFYLILVGGVVTGVFIQRRGFSFRH